ncbi:MAG: hypothetical protein AAF938_14925 [Myxococcota bacterium]
MNAKLHGNVDLIRVEIEYSTRAIQDYAAGDQQADTIRIQIGEEQSATRREFVWDTATTDDGVRQRTQIRLDC